MHDEHDRTHECEQNHDDASTGAGTDAVVDADADDAFEHALQARVAEVGQALLRRTQDAGGLGPRRKGKRSRFHMDAYEEHRILPEVLCCTLLPNSGPQVYLPDLLATLNNRMDTYKEHRILPEVLGCTFIPC